MTSAFCSPFRLCACALLLSGGSFLHAESATSIPCGYIQTDLYAKSTCYLGLGVHPKALVQHILQEENVTFSTREVVINDPDVNFNELMDKDCAYIMEFHFSEGVAAVPLNRNAWSSGSSCWTEHSVTVNDENFASLVKKAGKPTFYTLRQANTVDDILGADNRFGLKSGSSIAADAVTVFSSPTTKQVLYHSGTQWTRKGSTANAGNMPVFAHEPMAINRKAGTDTRAVVIGEVIQNDQLLPLCEQNTLSHTRLAIPHTLQELNIPNAVEVIHAPIGEKNALLKCNRTRTGWEDENGRDVSSIPLEGVLSILFPARIPDYILIQSRIPFNQ